MAYTLDTAISLGSAKSGLPLNATFIDTTGVAVPSQSGINGGFKEVGNGQYLWHYTQYTPDFRGAVVIHQSGTLHTGTNALATFAVNSQEAEYLDSRVSLISNTTVGTYRWTVQTQDQNAQYLGNTSLEIYPSGSNGLISKVVTSISNAQYIFNVDEGAYRIYAYNPYLAQFTNPYYIYINSDTSSILTGNKFSVDAPSDTSEVRLYSYLADLGLTEKEGISMTVAVGSPPESGGGAIMFTKDTLTGTSDSIGYVYVDCAAGVSVRCRINRCGFDKTFVTPLSGTLNLASLV